VVKGVTYKGGPIFGGSYGTMPEGTEVIARVDVSGYAIGYLNNQSPGSTKGWDASINVVAYKPDENTGRLVLNSSHPEYAESGEVLDFMSAVMQYTLEGARPLPALKGTLQNGNPTQAHWIGDRQYHRWQFELPAGVERLTILLEGEQANVDLYLNPGCPAHRFQSTAQAEGSTSEIALHQPQPGTWHLSAYGSHQLLNGAEYSLDVRWE
jgi:hypothetical protein